MMPCIMEKANNNLTSEEKQRYQRHFTLPDFGMEKQLKLKNAKVLVVGAGGLGSPVLLYLAAAGIGKIGMIDNDRVDISNLQRQVLYNTNDIGQSKAKTATDKLKSINPNIDLDCYEENLSTSNALEIIQKYDLIIDGTDNFPTRYLINDACTILEKPFIYGSVFRYEGQLAVFNYKGGPTYRDLYPEPPSPDSVPNCAEGGVLGILPGIIGCYQANEAIKIITGIGEVLSGKLMILDILSNQQQIIRLTKQANKPKIEHLINYDEFCGIKSNQTMIKEIIVKELKQMQESGEDFQLIDVREKNEYDFANLKGELIPLGDIPDATEKISKDKKVIIHCRSGARSAQAVEYLQKKLGHEHIYNLKGGILAWSDQIDPSIPKY